MKFFASFIFASAANSALIEGWYYIIEKSVIVQVYLSSFNLEGTNCNISKIWITHQTSV